MSSTEDPGSPSTSRSARASEGRLGTEAGGAGSSARVPAILNRGMLAWGVLVMVFSIFLADLTSYWWLLLIFGAALPAISAVRNLRASGDRGARPLSEAGEKERELLDALTEAGELTPMMAATRTTLTVKEATGLLEGLARQGHLKVSSQDGTLVYGSWEHDLRGPQGSPGETPETRPAGEAPMRASGPVPDAQGARTESPAEPLSEREVEVLRLLATGKTNREVARDLFVSVGTVKAHTSSIYRKLGARNRTEALGRARDLGLLQ